MSGPEGGFSTAVNQVLHILVHSPATAPLRPHCVIPFDRSPPGRVKITDLGRQQQRLLSAVALQLPAVLLEAAAVGDSRDDMLQWRALDTAELIIESCPELAKVHDGAAPSTAGAAAGQGSSTGADAAAAAAAVAAAAADSVGSSSNSKQLWGTDNVAAAVEEVLRCWCTVMQQQLQLAVQPPAKASTSGPSSSGSTIATPAGGQLALDTARLNSIIHLLPLLTQVSRSCTLMDVASPWASCGVPVLQLFEQYARTVLAHLRLEKPAHGKHNQHQHAQVSRGRQGSGRDQNQRQEQQAGGSEGRSCPRKDPMSWAGLHVGVRLMLCRCCSDVPGMIDTTRHKQFMDCLEELLLTFKTSKPSKDWAVGPLLHVIKSTPGGALQQQLLSLLFTCQKRMGASYQSHVLSHLRSLMAVPATVLGPLTREQIRELTPDAVAAHVTSTTQSVVAEGRHLSYLARNFQHYAAQAAAAVGGLEAGSSSSGGCGGGGSSTTRNGGKAKGRRRAGTTTSSSSSRDDVEAQARESLVDMALSISAASRSVACVAMTVGMLQGLCERVHIMRDDVVLLQVRADHRAMRAAVAQAAGQAAGVQEEQCAGTEQLPGQGQTEPQLQGMPTDAADHHIHHHHQQQQQTEEQQVQQGHWGMQRWGQQPLLPPAPQVTETLLGGEIDECMQQIMLSTLALVRISEAAVKAAQRLGCSMPAIERSRTGLLDDLLAAVQRPSPAEGRKLSAACNVLDCLAVLLACPEVQQLPQQLQAASELICAAVPSFLTCNNPACSNLSGRSELQLVQSKGSQCSACRAARYCSKACQTQHWKAHRPTCEHLVAAAAAETDIWGRIEAAREGHAAACEAATAAADLAEQLLQAADPSADVLNQMNRVAQVAFDAETAFGYVSNACDAMQAGWDAHAAWDAGNVDLLLEAAYQMGAAPVDPAPVDVLENEYQDVEGVAGWAEMFHVAWKACQTELKAATALGMAYRAAAALHAAEAVSTGVGSQGVQE